VICNYIEQQQQQLEVLNNNINDHLERKVDNLDNEKEKQLLFDMKNFDTINDDLHDTGNTNNNNNNADNITSTRSNPLIVPRSLIHSDITQPRNQRNLNNTTLILHHNDNSKNNNEDTLYQSTSVRARIGEPLHSKNDQSQQRSMSSKMRIKSRVSGYLDRFRNNNNSNSKNSNPLTSLVHQLHRLRIGTSSINSSDMGSNASNDHTTPTKQRKPTKGNNLIDEVNYNSNDTNETCNITTNTIDRNLNDLHNNTNNKNNNRSDPNFIGINNNNANNNNNNNNKIDQSSNFNKMAHHPEIFLHNTHQQSTITTIKATTNNTVRIDTSSNKRDFYTTTAPMTGSETATPNVPTIAPNVTTQPDKRKLILFDTTTTSTPTIVPISAPSHQRLENTSPIEQHSIDLINTSHGAHNCCASTSTGRETTTHGSPDKDIILLNESTTITTTTNTTAISTPHSIDPLGDTPRISAPVNQ
jgi:hypothetical protein